MRHWMKNLMCLSLVACAVPALALNPGTDVLVPAAAKAAPWVTDLYVMNAGSNSVNGTVYWLVRDQANPNPVGVDFNLLPGETMVMEDSVGNDFGLSSAAGAFRVVADGEVVVNSRIYSVDGTDTFGQGFEGIPVGAAIQAGQDTAAVGLSYNDAFRTNFYALTGPSGASLDLTLVAPDGTELASSTLTLNGAYRPYLKSLTQVFGSSLAQFDNASIVVMVEAGSAVVGASKVDNATGDPTTLESSVPLGTAGSVDGTYQFALYDDDTYASGGNIVIANGVVEAINGTYMNFQKDEDNDTYSDCLYIFLWGLGLPMDVPVEDFADGIEFTDSYETTNSGDLAWTLQFTMNGTTGLTGTLDAVGSNFPSSSDPLLDESGCNGIYPQLTLEGGKLN